MPVPTSKKRKDRDHDGPSRAERKAKKRKAEDAIPDLPGEVEEDLDDVVVNKMKLKEDDGDGGQKLKNVNKDDGEKKSKKERKAARKAATVVAEVATDEERAQNKTAAPTGPIEEEEKEERERKSKKERKTTRKAAEAARAAEVERAHDDESRPPQSKPKKKKHSKISTEVEPTSTASPSASSKVQTHPNSTTSRVLLPPIKDADEDEDNSTTSPAPPPKHSSRFIVFVGNLPYDTTTTALTSHFSSLHPLSIRHLTQKDAPEKSRGIAFVEFEAYDAMKTALKKFHHSMFEGRKINVELTAGGGGKTKHRKAKIGEKNSKLNEQRARRMKAEEEEKVKKREMDGEEKIGHEEAAIHPSRRGRVPWEMREGPSGGRR